MSVQSLVEFKDVRNYDTSWFDTGRIDARV